MTEKLPILVFATNNAHKISELRQIVGDAFVVKSLHDIGCQDDIPENENTLEGNALAKARWVNAKYGVDCFADDTGLEVDSLNGEPGVRSARYAGDNHDSEANMKLLLDRLCGKDNRVARFRTVIALIKDNKEHIFEGSVNGVIATAPSGKEGFGYDPIFIPDGDTRSFAEYSAEEKNAISHRGLATSKLIEFLKNNKH